MPHQQGAQLLVAAVSFMSNTRYGIATTADGPRGPGRAEHHFHDLGGVCRLP